MVMARLAPLYGNRAKIAPMRRSAQEYLAIRQNMAEPDPLRLAWRELIKNTIYAVVTQPEAEPLSVIQRAVADVPDAERESVQALVVEELGAVTGNRGSHISLLYLL
jgi:hypothetical protein